MYVDVALAPLDYEPPDPKGSDASARDWSARRFSALVDRLRAIGLDRVVFGSDWPVVAPGVYWDALARRLPLEPVELERLRTNKAPWLAPS